MRAVLVAIPVFALSLAGCVSDDKGSSSVPACEREMPEGFPTSSVGIGDGDTAPDLDMIDDNGDPLCTRDYAGRVLMINIAAGWCPPCRSETPDIQEAYAELKDQGFRVVMAMIDDYSNNGNISDEDFFTDWREEYDITFELVSDEQADTYLTYVDENDPNYGGIPATIILDRDQRVSFSQIGAFTSPSQITNVVEPLLEQDAQLEY